MNSFLGVMSFDDRPPDEVSFRKAAESLTGPKLDVAYLATECGGFLQARWTDAVGNATVKPTTVEHGRFVILWDGRIDNRRELASLFGADSKQADRWGDAEYAVRAYLRWGNACVSHILGDFAFAVWDERERRLFCARDPMGIRPLYYRQEPGRVLVASDALPIARLTHGVTPNESLLALYVRAKPGSPHETFFSGVSQVPAGHTATMTERALNVNRYWEPNPWDRNKYASLDECAEHFLDVFDAAVRARLNGAQTVGISLSGGLDSTSIACSAARLIPEMPDGGVTFKAFSSVFEQVQSADESAFIRDVQHKMGLDVHYMAADQFWGWNALKNEGVWSQPYPIPFMARHEALLNEAQNQGCSAMLTGEGGDELLYQGLPHLADLIRDRRIREFRHEFNHLMPVSKRMFLKSVVLWMMPAMVLRSYDKARPKENLNTWLNERKIGQAEGPAYPVRPPHDRRRGSLHADVVYTAVVNVSRSPFLVYLTEAYRRHGIEARHPFFDLRVIDFLTRMPPEFKFRHGRSKYLLRYALRERLPESILQRREKTHFTDVTLIGLRNGALRLKNLVASGYARDHGWIDYLEFERCFSLAQSGDAEHAARLARLISLEAWARQPTLIELLRNNDAGAVSTRSG